MRGDRGGLPLLSLSTKAKMAGTLEKILLKISDPKISEGTVAKTLNLLRIFLTVSSLTVVITL